MGSAIFQNLLAAFIILAIFAIIYCRITNKTLVDLYKEIKEIISGGEE